MAAPSPLRPRPPLATRLNRHALTVATGILGLTVLTALLVGRPRRDSRALAAAEPGLDEPPPEPSRPTFLDEPVRAPVPALDTTPLGVPVPPSRDPATGGPDGARDGPAPTPAPGLGPGPTARAAAYRAALASPLLGPSPAPPVAPGAPPAREAADGSALAAEEERVLSLGDSLLHAAARAGADRRGGAPPPAPPAAGRHRAFLDAAGDARGAPVRAVVAPAGSPYTLWAGTVIPGLLLTGITSDLPGDLVAQVSRDVYDSRDARWLLIPKGARLLGTYDTEVVPGDGRLLVAWRRLLFPDGQSVVLPGVALTDRQGQTGATGQVDTHWGRVVGQALLVSAIAAGVELSQPRSATVLAPPSAGQVAAGALGQELSSVTLELLRRGMDVAPTITIPPGQAFDVVLNGDLVFDGPFAPAPPDARAAPDARVAPDTP